jgi:hypothetical protein
MRRLTTEEFIKKSKEIHGEKYDYSKTIYGKGNKENVVIICSVHGEFYQKPIYHLCGEGCSSCGIERSKNLQKNGVKDFIKNSIKIHGNLYDYSKINYVNAHTKISILCRKHGEFQQKPNNHLNGRGCPKCNLSKAELKIIKFLEINNIEYASQKKFNNCVNPKTNRPLKFDFYIPSKNLLIEYDGSQHFKIGCCLGGYVNDTKDLKTVQYRDKLKTQYARQNDIKLLRIKFTRFNQIDKILKSVLKLDFF